MAVCPHCSLDALRGATVPGFASFRAAGRAAAEPGFQKYVWKNEPEKAKWLSREGRRASRLRPVFEGEAGDLLKIAGVTGHEDGVVFEDDGGDGEVHPPHS